MINRKMIFFLKKEITKIFKDIYIDNDFDEALDIKEKSDKSVVTKIDLLISDLVKSQVGKYEEHKHLSFYSEEDMDQFTLPCLVLDPIDGTKALTTGVPECCVSLAVVEKDLNLSSGWLYNPFNGFEISSDDDFVMAPSFTKPTKLVGMVSGSDFKKGIFSAVTSSKIILYPKGSIAYKLGLLAAGACDFIYSATPKNVWDIAAGTIILETRGFKMYQKGEEVTELDRVHLEGDLLWCRMEVKDQIRQELGLL